MSFRPSIFQRLVLLLYAAAIFNVGFVVSFHIIGTAQRLTTFAGSSTDFLWVIVAFILFHWCLFKMIQLLHLCLSPAPSLSITEDGITCRMKGSPTYAFIPWKAVDDVQKGGIIEPRSTVLIPHKADHIEVTYYWWFKLSIWLRRFFYNKPSDVPLKPSKIVLGPLMANISAADLYALTYSQFQQHADPTFPLHSFAGDTKAAPVQKAHNGIEAVRPRYPFLSPIINLATILIALLPVLFFVFGTDLGKAKIARNPEALRSQELIDYAKAGDPRAQLMVGLRFENGIGLPKSSRKALSWYERAAQQGMSEAQYNAGIAYMQGRGTAIDYPKALKWLSKARDQDFPPAFSSLGFIYLNGFGVPQSDQEAFKHFRIGANLGDPNAQYLLGTLYENGTGTAQNINRAIEFYQLAARSGSPHARRALNRLGNNPF